MLRVFESCYVCLNRVTFVFLNHETNLTPKFNAHQEARVKLWPLVQEARKTGKGAFLKEVYAESDR